MEELFPKIKKSPGRRPKPCNGCGQPFKINEEKVEVALVRIIKNSIGYVIGQKRVQVELYHMGCYDGGKYGRRKVEEEPHQEQALP